MTFDLTAARARAEANHNRTQAREELTKQLERYDRDMKREKEQDDAK